MYVEGVLPEMVRLHTRPTYTAARFFPPADHFLGSHLMYRIDVTGDRSLVVSKLYPTSNPSAPYLRGTLGRRGRVLCTEPATPAGLGWGMGGCRRPCLRSHECDGRVGRDGGGGRWPLEPAVWSTDVDQMRILSPIEGETDANLVTLLKVLPSERDRTIEGDLRASELLLYWGIKYNLLLILTTFA